MSNHLVNKALLRPIERGVALADAQQGLNPYVSQPAEYGWPFLSRRILLSREPRLIRVTSAVVVFDSVSA